MRNGSHVLDHNDFQTCGLESADSSLTSLAGALHLDLDALQAASIDGCLGGSLGCHLGSVGSGLSGTAEAQTTGGSPGQGVAFQVGDGDHYRSQR